MLRDQLDSEPGCAAQITTVLILAACRLGDAELGETLVKKCAGQLWTWAASPPLPCD